MKIFFKKPLLLTIIIFTFNLLVIAMNFDMKYMAGGDQALYYYPGSYAKHIMTMWDSNYNHSLGGQNIFMHYLLPIPFFYRILSFLPIIYVQYIYFALVLSSILLSSLYFCKLYLFNEILPSFVASLSYLLNLFFFVSYVNYNIHLSFIILPLLLILANKLRDVHYSGIICLSLIVSFIVPGAFINPPAVIPVFGVFIIYLAYIITKQGIQKLNVSFFVGCLVCLFCFLAINLWWLVPFIHSYYYSGGGDTLNTLNFRIFHTTSLHDVIRFLGGWAFNPTNIGISDGRYDSLYNNFFFILVTYGIIFLAFFSIIFWRKNKDILFFLLLSLCGIFLSKGDLPPFAGMYQYALQNIPFFYIFREPYVKFALIYVFAISILLGFFIKYANFKKLEYKFIPIVLIFFYSAPFFIGGFVPSRTSEGIRRSYLINTPDYMHEYNKENEKFNNDYYVFVPTKDLKTQLWPNGGNIFEMAIRPFTSKRILNYKADYSTHQIPPNIESMYEMYQNGNVFLPKFLGFLNVGELHWFKDLDWRYTDNPLYFKPSEVQSLITGRMKDSLTLQASFPKFTEEYLETIPNLEKDDNLRNELYVELVDKNIIDIYKIDESILLPKVYVPQATLLSISKPQDFYKSVYTPAPIRSQIIVKDKAQNLSNLLDISDAIIITGSKVDPLYPPEHLEWNNEWDWPVVQISPMSPEYELMRRKESKILLEESDPLKRIDYNLWYMAERVEEMDKYRVLGPKKTDILENFVEMSNSSVEIVENLAIEQSSEILQLRQKTYQYLLRGAIQLKSIGIIDKFVYEPISYEYRNWMTQLAKLDEVECQYKFDIPNPGKYLLGEALMDGTVKIVKEVSFDNLQFTDGWLTYEVSCMELDKYSEVVMSIDEWKADGSMSLKEIRDWQPRYKYALSFKYKVAMEMPATVSVLADFNDYSKIGDEPGKVNWSIIHAGNFPHRNLKLLDAKLDINNGNCKQTDYDCFSYYEKTFTVPPESLTGYIQFAVPSNSHVDNPIIKDIEIKRLDKSDVVMYSSNLNLELGSDSKLPKITFNRVNDSLYKVVVEESFRPFYLVFNEGYNKNWRLMFRPKFNLKIDDREIVHKYFDSQVIELSGKDKYLSAEVQDSWKSSEIASEKHYEVNNFANSWYVTPGDVKNLSNYELYIEYFPQRMGYIAMFFSIISFVFLVLFLFVLVVKKFR